MAQENSFLPPSDIQAEQALLGSLLLNGKLLDDVVDKLKVEDFYDPRHRLIYKVMLELWNKNKPIDVLFVLGQIESKSEDTGVDKDFLVALIAHSSLSKSAVATAGIIHEKALLRAIIDTGDEMKNLAVSDSTPQEILDEAQQKLYSVSQEAIDKNFVSLSEVLGPAFERISELSQSPEEFRGIPTGLTDLDKKLGGLHKSDLVILAARPGMGKTSLILEITKRVALKQSGVAFFSLEMSRDQLVDKLLASVSEIENWKIRTGKFSSNEEFAKLGEAIGKLDQAPIWIDDSGGLNILELRSKARRLKSRHNIELIVIDYLQLMSSPKRHQNRVQEVSEISRGLKLLAKELNIPVIALSQLSRGVEGRDDKKPMLSDLRESGSIEQDADLVLFIHRDEYYNKESKKKGIADVIISKHRHGEIGSVELAWISHLATFGNLDGARLSRWTPG